MVIRILAPRLTVAVAASLPSFAFTLAAVLIPSTLGASFLMPQRTALIRDVRGEDDPPLLPQVSLLLVALGVLAMLQVPALAAWWREESTVLRNALGQGADPLGLNLVPRTIALALPTVAALTLGLFVVTSLLAIVASSTLASRVLGACVLLQLGYVGSTFIVIGEVRTIQAALAPLFTDDPTAARQVSEWITRHDTAASASSLRLAWTCVGYVIAAVTAYVSRVSARAEVVVQPTIEPAVITPIAVQPDVQSLAVPVVSAAAARFVETEYSVHPRMTLLESWFTRKCTHFEIRTIPHRTRQWFSFSWDTGLLRQEPAGAELLRLRPAKPPGLFLNRTYEVVNPGPGDTIAKFIPRGSDWEIEDAHGNIAARVVRNDGRFDFVKYRVFVGQSEVCKFKWALAGLTTSAAQLEIVFLDGTSAASSVDRGIVVAIAPILEQQARIANEPRN